MSFINSFREIPMDELREDVEKHLQWAYAHGHLSLAGLEERLNKLQDCKSKESLLILVEDLPSQLEESGENSRREQPQGPPPRAKEELFALLGSQNRKGAWKVPQKLQCTAILGSINLDLREAFLYHREIEVEGFCFLGSIDLRLPENIEVVTSGFPLLGSINNRTKPKNPEYRLHLHGMAVLGSMDARTRRR